MKFQVGDEVEHEAFGHGTVESVSPGRVTVDFPSLDEKTLALSMVHFKRVWRGSLELGAYDGSQQFPELSLAASGPAEPWRPPIRKRPDAPALPIPGEEPQKAADLPARSALHTNNGTTRPRGIEVDLEAVKADLAAGLTLKAIAAKTGISYQTLYGRIRKAGIKVGCRPDVYRTAYQKAHENGVAQTSALSDPPSSRPPLRSAVLQKEKRMPIAKGVDRDEMVRLYEDGLSANQVGKKLGLTGSTVNYYLHKAGVVLRKASRQPGAAIQKSGRPKSGALIKAADPTAGSALHLQPAAVNGNGHARVRFRFVEVEVDGAGVADAIAALNKALEAKL